MKKWTPRSYELGKVSNSEARFQPHGSVISPFPFGCAGLTTNILIVFTLMGTLGAAEERPALPLLQSWNYSNKRANLWPDLHQLDSLFPPSQERCTHHLHRFTPVLHGVGKCCNTATEKLQKNHGIHMLYSVDIEKWK